MLAQQIAFEANNITRLLDELALERRRGRRRDLLQMATRASQRALAQLQREPLVYATSKYVDEAFLRHDLNPWAAREELRGDRETIRWFVNAECDLLRVNGFDERLIDKLRRDIMQAMAEPSGERRDSLSTEFEQLLVRMDDNLRALAEQAADDRVHRNLAAVLGVLGGCGIVAADTAAAVGTAGAGAFLLAASVPVGTEIVTRSAQEALD